MLTHRVKGEKPISKVGVPAGQLLIFSPISGTKVTIDIRDLELNVGCRL
jgi:hypothetical protein